MFCHISIVHFFFNAVFVLHCIDIKAWFNHKFRLFPVFDYYKYSLYKPAVNIFFINTILHFSWISGYQDLCTSNFSRICQPVFQRDCTTLYSQQQVLRFQLLYILTNTWHSSLFNLILTISVSVE